MNLCKVLSQRTYPGQSSLHVRKQQLYKDIKFQSADQITRESEEFVRSVFGAESFEHLPKYDGDHPGDPDKRNLRRLIAISSSILLGTSVKLASWDKTTLEQIKLNYRNRSELMEHRLRIARQLHCLLNNNETLGLEKRDDAKTFRDYLKILMKENGIDSKFNKIQFLRDWVFFTIPNPTKLTKFTPLPWASNAGFNLGGGRRLGCVGWKPRYYDAGQLFEDDKKTLRNQAVHFTGFFVLAECFPEKFMRFLAEGFERAQAVWDYRNLEGLFHNMNPQDTDLSLLAIDIHRDLKEGKFGWKKLPDKIYKGIKEKQSI